MDENQEIEIVTEEVAMMNELEDEFQKQAGNLENNRAHHAQKLQWTRQFKGPIHDLIETTRQKIFELGDSSSRLSVALEMLHSLDKYLVQMETQLIADERYAQGLRDASVSCSQTVSVVRDKAAPDSEIAIEPGQSVRPVGQRPEKLSDSRNNR